MKVQVTTEFYCSYFRQATQRAVARMEAATDVFAKLVEAVQCVILAQCVLESYVNYLIHEKSLGNVNASKGKKFDRLSIKDKWRELPKAVNGSTFNETLTPFTDFVELVDLRNKLVHFKTKKMDSTVEFPNPNAPDKATVGDVLAILLQPEVMKLISHNASDVAAKSIATVDTMIDELHQMLGTDSPNFASEDELIKLDVIDAT